MKQFKKTVITPIAVSGQKKLSNQLLLSGDTEVSVDKRKSLRTSKRDAEEALDPTAPNLSVYPFLVIVSCFVSFRRYVVSVGKKHFTPDMFIVLLLVASCGKLGVSSSSCTKLFCVVRDSGSSMRAVSYKLDSLLSCKLLVRSVKNRYYLSVHAEKILTRSISKKDFNELHKLVRAFCK